MKRDLAIIITGIHTEKFIPQAIDLMAWSIRWRGLEAKVFRMHWHKSRSYAKKEIELVKLIEELSGNYRVSLIGISAGGTAALNVLAKTDKIHKVITAGGWSKSINETNERCFEKLAEQSKAFREAVEELTKNYEKIKYKTEKILAFRSSGDEIVPYEVAAIEGSRIVDIEVRGHVRAIAFSLIGYRREIVDFVLR